MEDREVSKFKFNAASTNGLVTCTAYVLCFVAIRSDGYMGAQQQLTRWTIARELRWGEGIIGVCT